MTCFCCIMTSETGWVGHTYEVYFENKKINIKIKSLHSHIGALCLKESQAAEKMFKTSKDYYPGSNVKRL